ncbi:hypothetical protein NMY22_g4550 [Coprinellus aureogranulatus]|nr:hypothetical protein NMY22_g4550 [Coprinellus aureogranulatus]
MNSTFQDSKFRFWDIYAHYPPDSTDNNRVCFHSSAFLGLPASTRQTCFSVPEFSNDIWSFAYVRSKTMKHKGREGLGLLLSEFDVGRLLDAVAGRMAIRWICLWITIGKMEGNARRGADGYPADDHSLYLEVEGPRREAPWNKQRSGMSRKQTQSGRIEWTTGNCRTKTSTPTSTSCAFLWTWAQLYGASRGPSGNLKCRQVNRSKRQKPTFSSTLHLNLALSEQPHLLAIDLRLHSIFYASRLDPPVGYLRPFDFAAHFFYSRLFYVDTPEMASFIPSNRPSTKLGHLRQLSKRAGVHVSPLQLGGMSIGESAWGSAGMGDMTKEKSFKLLDTFWEAGGNFIDTAGFYQDGTSEQFIGEWAEQRGIRDQIITRGAINCRMTRWAAQSNGQSNLFADVYPFRVGSKYTKTRLVTTRMGRVIPESTYRRHQARDADLRQQQSTVQGVAPAALVINRHSSSQSLQTAAGSSSELPQQASATAAPQPSRVVVPDLHQFDENTGERMRHLLEEIHATTAGPVDVRNAIHMLVSMLGAWLHLACGLSREATNTTLKAVSILVDLVLLFAWVSNEDFDGDPHSLPSLSVPDISLRHDVRTAIQHLSLDPTIHRIIVCPKCMKSYELSKLPERCPYRETSRSRRCNEVLYVRKHTLSGERIIPRQMYSFQDFKTWLEFFLSRPGIEDLIDRCYTYIPPDDGVMDSIWDSPAWRSLGPFTTTPGNLTFSFFIDWFNPFTNKIAGKSVSCGAIMMFCLNLPYELQHLPENTFFAGITPPPREPTITMLNRLTEPLMTDLSKYHHGVTVKTFRHPIGVSKNIAVLPVIGDLGAVRKAMATASVRSDKNVCSFCKTTHDGMDCLDLSALIPRIGIEVTVAAEEWRAATTKARRKALFTKNGVRWSPMYLLSYRDPVQHTMIGVLHNWFEGVLQHHVRVLWGLGAAKKSSKSADPDGATTPMLARSPTPSEGDVPVWDSDTVSEEEVAALIRDSESQGDTPSSVRRSVSTSSMHESDHDMHIDDDQDDEYIGNEESSDEEEGLEDDEEANLDEGVAGCIFTKEELQALRSAIASIVLPAWVERPPTNLGEATHGKLKGDQWLTLFLVFLPLALPEIWIRAAEQDVNDAGRYLSLLDNFYHVCSCTAIISAYSTSDKLADEYTSHYIEYRQSCLALFPRIKTRPNHHIALHNGPVLKFWGPVVKLSEAPFERHNGLLQKVETSHKLRDLDYTMLRQICSRGRLAALTRQTYAVERDTTASPGTNESVAAGPMLADAAHLFQEKTYSTDIRPSSSSATDRQRRKLKELPDNHYLAILEFLRRSRPHLSARNRKDLPHPLDSYVLSKFATPLKHITHNTRTFSTYSQHIGNSSISYAESDDVNEEDKLRAGFITDIWRIQILDEFLDLIVVVPHLDISHDDLNKSPYHLRSNFQVDIFYDRGHPSGAEAQAHIIEQHNIHLHVPFYRRPQTTFNIDKDILIAIYTLHRFRIVIE